jgi:hypothetical protein
LSVVLDASLSAAILSPKFLLFWVGAPATIFAANLAPAIS